MMLALMDGEHCYGLWANRESMEASFDSTFDSWTYLANDAISVKHQNVNGTMFVKNVPIWQSGEKFM